MKFFEGKSGAPFAIRKSKPEDEPILIEMASSEHMDGLQGFDDTLVAEDEQGIAGFCRVRTYRGVHYVNPIITAPRVRGQHVGIALMEESLAEHGELRFVARGYAVPFYRSLGCVAIDWNSIAPEVAADCDDCEFRGMCRPQPMLYR